jgi:hypothetical protein
MISDADLMAIYDFEGVLSSAVASVFTKYGFTAGNALTILSDPEFQRQRPRVEIFVQVTGIPQPIQSRPIFDGSLRNMAYRGSLEVSAVSNMDSSNSPTHAIYRAKVRNFCATLGNRVNGGALTKHKIQQIVEGGTTLDALNTGDLP